MPIYEYECEKCGEVFELRRPIDKQDEKTRCPVCGDQNCHRIYSVSSILASGSCSGGSSDAGHFSFG